MSPQVPPPKVWSVPLVRPEATYEVRLSPSIAKPLQIWRNGRLLDSYLKSSYRPWKLEVADVEGDGLPEIAIGVVRRTRNKPFDHNCLFIMRFDGKRLVKKWMGSSMGRPLLDFHFGSSARGKPAVLYTLERTLEDRVALSGWDWDGFGFKKHKREYVWDAVSDVEWRSKSLILTIVGRRVILGPKELP